MGWHIETLVAYIAGLFDGEGSIGIYPCGPSGYNRRGYHLFVTLTQKDRRILDALKTTFGGSVQRANTCHHWRLYANDAAEFLRLLRPYLILKREQAELAVMFQRLPWRGRPKGFRLKGQVGGNRAKSDAQMEIDQKFSCTVKTEKIQATYHV
jgi:hypothetical protein